MSCSYVQLVELFAGFFSICPIQIIKQPLLCCAVTVVYGLEKVNLFPDMDLHIIAIKFQDVYAFHQLIYIYPRFILAEPDSFQ